jgi:hypothetical protein
MATFDMTIDRQPDPKGDRVKIGMTGKFLPFKQINYVGALCRANKSVRSILTPSQRGPSLPRWSARILNPVSPFRHDNSASPSSREV